MAFSLPDVVNSAGAESDYLNERVILAVSRLKDMSIPFWYANNNYRQRRLLAILGEVMLIGACLARNPLTKYFIQTLASTPITNADHYESLLVGEAYRHIFNNFDTTMKRLGDDTTEPNTSDSEQSEGEIIYVEEF